MVRTDCFLKRSVDACWEVYSPMLALYSFVIGVSGFDVLFARFDMFWALGGHITPHTGAALYACLQNHAFCL